jgi:hypothetical protein
LDAAGYETVPARGVPEAVNVLEDLGVWVDVLIARRTLPGADGFAAELRSLQQGQLKTIALIDQSDEPSDSIAAWDGCQDKNVADAIAGPIFLSLVQSVLTKGTIPRRF